jgi:hypothetical protein
MTTNTTAVRQPTLTVQLAARIAGEPSATEPYIIQDRVPQTHSRHVVVIWDAWDEMDRTARSQIIADAFRQTGIRDNLTVALGLTQQEAMSMGYLPYQIIANWKKGDGERAFKALRKAVREAPGVHVRTGASEQLRYPSLEHAQDAYRHLSAVVQGPYWAIVKENGAIE